MIILWVLMLLLEAPGPSLHDDNDSSMLFSFTSILDYIILITVPKITEGLSLHNCAVIKLKLKCTMIKCNIKLSSLIIKSIEKLVCIPK